MIISKRTQRLALVIALIVSLAELVFSTQALISPWVYRKDFIQEYLLARAVLTGADPYLPLPQLAERLIGPLELGVFPHPTPHPPPVAIITLPFGLLSYQQAAIAWFGFEVICILIAAHLLLRWWRGKFSVKSVVIVTLISFFWSPVIDELVIGQLNTLLTLLLINAWLALREDKVKTGGAFLGGVIALKLMAWPVILLLGLRRQWRAVVMAALVFIAANLLAAVLMGPGRVRFYFQEVGATVAPMYRAHEANFSVWTIGWRLFEGTHNEIVRSIDAPPLVAAPVMARVVSFSIPALLLLAGLFLAGRGRCFDTAFGLMTCVSILINPIAWSHYLLLTIVPVLVCYRYLTESVVPRTTCVAVAVIGLLLFFPREWLRTIMLWFATSRQLSGEETVLQVPFAIGLLSLLPAMAILGLIWLIWHLDRIRPATEKSSGAIPSLSSPSAPAPHQAF